VSQLSASLPKPVRYFPLEKGVYEVAAGLKTLTTDFGNGRLDGQVFQLDQSFSRFRKNKEACRAERLSKYYREHECPPSVMTAICRLITRKLLEENPEHFTLKEKPEGFELGCRLTDETLRFDREWRLLGPRQYDSAFDALAMQVSEDLNVLVVDPSTKKNWLAASHLCAPSSWRAEDKIGKDFFAIHTPVPTIEPMLKAASGLVQAMVYKGPYVRFVWGMTTHDRPNHHPDPPEGASREEWRGKPLTSALSAGEPIYLWVERQITLPCPEAHASLFTIRASFIPLAEVRENARERDLLIETYRSMHPSVREYKGLDEAYEPIMKWLE
jgi:hypothetical protein